jgi:hypothetical protein
MHKFIRINKIIKQISLARIKITLKIIKIARKLMINSIIISKIIILYKLIRINK